MTYSSDLKAGNCNIISIDALRGRSSQYVKWTNVMATAPQENAELAFLLAPFEKKHLVLCRNYGDITDITLDDAEINENTVIRVPTKHFATFLEPCVKSLVLPGLETEYNVLELYLTRMNLPVMGPLSSARTVFNMHHQGCSPAAAIQMATDEKNALVAQQTARLKIVDTVMQKV